MLIQSTLNSHSDAQPGNPYANVFGYKSFIAVVNELQEFNGHFVTDILPAIQSIVTAQTVFDSLVSIDLADPSAEYTTLFPSGTVGAQSGHSLPPWATASFEYRRKTRGDRSGRKGFSLVPEGGQDEGIVSAGYRIDCVAAAIVLETPLNVGLVDTWFPVILVRPVPPATVWTSHDISGVLFKRLGSQNTRKR